MDSLDCKSAAAGPISESMQKRRCSPSTFDFLGLTHFSAITGFHENKLVLRVPLLTQHLAAKERD
jgi:hypothetical protein